MKDEIGEKMIIKFVRLTAKISSYLIGEGSENKKAKGTKKSATKRKVKLKNCLEATQPENKQIIYEKLKLTQIVLKKIIKNSQKAIN